jgi:hypothetical protein
MTNNSHGISDVRRLARDVFLTFLLTFIGSRVLVILIMTRRIPDLFLHTRGTHVHHLNYGIFLISAVGALLLFLPPLSARLRRVCGLMYAFGMALTFDEFGMWFHLGGSYWQRGSFDAVTVLLSAFGCIAFMPRLDRMRTHHWATIAATAIAVVGFYLLLFDAADKIGARFGPHLQEIEESGPQ